MAAAVITDIVFTDKMVESAIRRTIKTSDRKQMFEVRKVGHAGGDFTIDFACFEGTRHFTVKVPAGAQNYEDLTDLVCTVGERVHDCSEEYSTVTKAAANTKRDMDVLSQILMG